MCVWECVRERGRLGALFYRSLDQLTINSVTNNSCADVMRRKKNKPCTQWSKSYKKTTCFLLPFSAMIQFSFPSLLPSPHLRTNAAPPLSHRAWPSHNPWPSLSQTARWFSAAPLYAALDTQHFMNQHGGDSQPPPPPPVQNIQYML